MALSAEFTASKVNGRIASPLPGGGRFGLVHGRNNVGIGAAATEIAAHGFAYRGIAARVALVHAADRRQDLPRRTIAALESIVIHERLLHGMEVSVRSDEALDGRDRAALHARGQRKTRQHAPP